MISGARHRGEFAGHGQGAHGKISVQNRGPPRRRTGALSNGYGGHRRQSGIREFLDHRLDEAAETSGADTADEEFFEDLVLGVVKQQRAIDPVLDDHLAQGWHLSRIDSILRAILRAAAYEITSREDVPARVVINEYLDIAHAFFDGEEPKVVNGILDKLARARRAQEFEQESDG